jgi:hypothetical protein
MRFMIKKQKVYEGMVLLFCQVFIFNCVLLDLRLGQCILVWGVSVDAGLRAQSSGSFEILVERTKTPFSFQRTEGVQSMRGLGLFLK